MASRKTMVTGDKQVDRKLAQLPLKIQKALIRSSLRKSGKLVQGRAKQNLEANDSVDTGDLKKGVRVRASKRSRTRVGIFISTTERKEESRWPFGGAQLEFGRHGVKAKAFLRPAGYGSEPQIRAFFVQDIRVQLMLLAMGFDMKGVRLQQKAAGQ